MTLRIPAIRVAVVDDHNLFREGLCQLLERSSGTSIEVVFAAGGGQEAISRLPACPADVVLMDVQMPGMDGIAATREIVLQHAPTAVIGLSSFSEAAPVREMVSAGASGYLLKNASKEELIDAIGIVAEGGRFFTASVAEFVGRTKLADSGPVSLSKREVDVLRLLCSGKTNREIATAMYISKRTVDGHRLRIMHKIGARHQVDMFSYAARKGIIA